MKKLLATLVLLSFIPSSWSQTTPANYPTQDSVHVFWQPDVKLTRKDYQGTTNENSQRMNDKYDMKVNSSIGIWSILDVAKKKKERYIKMEKVYFAPAFERTTSVAVTDDSLEIEKENVFFDICELGTRFARAELKKLEDTTNATGSMSLMYMTIKKQMEERRAKLAGAYFQDVFVQKNEGAFEEWRTLIDRRLEETKMWSTTPQECYRLMTGKPVEKGYIQAEHVVGPLF